MDVQDRLQHETEVRIPVGEIALAADWVVPANALGAILFAHGSGSSRHSPRNRRVARVLQDAGFATLLLDLLTHDEEAIDDETAELRFDVHFLAKRLEGATSWVLGSREGAWLPLGYFGASTGAAAALIAAAERPDVVRAIVSRGGRPDLAGAALRRVQAPTLLLVGSLDLPVIRLNREAYGELREERRIEIVQGASHLFEEPGALDEVAHMARDWFLEHLAGEAPGRIRVAS
jgi:putative phosphoribosyl transferase